jgi:hypothetical protein
MNAVLTVLIIVVTWIVATFALGVISAALDRSIGPVEAFLVLGVVIVAVLMVRRRSAARSVSP